MKCPACQKEGQKSRVYEGGGMTTLMYCSPFYDEEGEYHSHDMNSTTYSFSCSRGHTWSETRHHQCPNPKCNWGKNGEGE